MIKEDRIQLNERFRKVFALLEDRGEVILNDRGGKGMGDFAEMILGNRAYGHIIRAYLNPKDKRVIDYNAARKVCRFYNVNESYLIDGIGTPFGIELPKRKESEVLKPIGNILFTSAEAFAGATIDLGSSHTEDHQYYSIPGVSGSGYVSFPVNGNSMEPVIQHNDIVICQRVENMNEIKDDEIYAIKSSGSLWIKYIRIIRDEDGLKFKLISANHLEHDPFIEEVDPSTRVYKVVRRISDVP
ncbi:MAG: peptidase S24/S26A/S26B [Bacteroidia bacterium]|nr:peptidase S24/S26A/S26B [Bacteroidia bacterium]